MNWKYPLFAGLTASLFTLGCNSNPVTVPGNDDTPLAFSQDPSGNNPKVDLLWMIDDSGSMAEEQAGIVEQLDGLAGTLESSGIDFHIAVTSTDGSSQSSFANNCGGGSTPVPAKACLPGQFRDRANPQLSDAGLYTIAKVRTVLNTIADNCLADSSSANISAVKKKFENFVSTNSYTDDTTVGSGGSVLSSDVNKNLPTLADMRVIPPVLERKAYLQAGGFNKEQLRKDLACLTLVGTNGSGVEKGLAAVVDAVDPKGPNKALQFVRANARAVVVLVSDENDCTHEAIKVRGVSKDIGQEDYCYAALCNYFNDVNVDKSLNPLVPPSKLAERFVKNLKDSKGAAGAGFSAADVSAIAVTGTAMPRPGTPGNATVDKSIVTKAMTEKFLSKVGGTWNQSSISTDVCMVTSNVPLKFDSKSKLKTEKVACSNVLGTSVTGDRYYSFIKNFGQYSPSKDSDIGYLCNGNFSPVFDTIKAFVTGAGGDCITNKLLSCDNPGEQCGPEEAPGTCQAYPYDPSSYFCSAAIQYTLSGPDASFTPAVKALCLQNSVASAGGTSSCVIDPSKYEYKQCAGKVKGVTIKMKQSTDAATLQGQNLTQNYKFSGYVPSEDDDTSSP